MQKSVYQHTVAGEVSVSGVGVHSGVTATITLLPAAVDTGVTFIRTDVTDRDNIIAARWHSVADTRLCTVVANTAGVSVSTIEHLMSAFAAAGLDNVTVKIDGPEMPIMDGSAEPFLRALEKVGLEKQQKPRRVLIIKKPVSVVEGDKQALISPADGQFFGFEIDFGSAAIGRQKFTLSLKEAVFRKEIASARTFGFLHEVEALRKMGLARGGSLENAIVIEGDRVLNPEGLRYKNEFVRHKILDAIGDLYLAGGQLIGHYHGVKAGHAMNNKLLHAVFADRANYEWVDLNQRDLTVIRAAELKAPAALAGELVTA